MYNSEQRVGKNHCVKQYVCNSEQGLGCSLATYLYLSHKSLNWLGKNLGVCWLCKPVECHREENMTYIVSPCVYT